MTQRYRFVVFLRSKKNGFFGSKVTAEKQDNIDLQPFSFPQRKFIRCKSNKTSNPSNQHSDDESDSEEEAHKADKTLSLIRIQSSRVDTLIKAFLGIPRSQIEKMFYKGQLKLNGKKLMKKSYQCQIDDEIDVIHEVDEENPDLLIASCVEIIEKKYNTANGLHHITVRGFKKLKIENYPGSDRYTRTE